MGQLWGHNTDISSILAFRHNDLRSLYLGEIDAATEVGEPGGARDGVDGACDGCEGERQVHGEQDAVFGEEERPIRREVFEARPAEKDGRTGDGGGEAGADFPGLHGGLLP